MSDSADGVMYTGQPRLKSLKEGDVDANTLPLTQTSILASQQPMERALTRDFRVTNRGAGQGRNVKLSG